MNTLTQANEALAGVVKMIVWKMNCGLTETVIKQELRENGASELLIEKVYRLAEIENK